MVWSRLNAFAIFMCVVLPACLIKKGTSRSSYVKKSSQRLEGNDSIFTSLSEVIIRDGVREQYAAQRKEQQHVKSEPVKEHKKGKRNKRLSCKKRLALARECARQQEAKLVDIPLPLNVKPVSEFFYDDHVGSADSSMLAYTTDQPLDEIADFFKQGMERHGWRCRTSFSGLEHLMHFTKPKRFCSISLRPHAGKRRGNRVNSGIFIVTGPART